MKRFLFCLLISLVCSCSKFEESDIPYAPVYLELDLRFGDKDLVGIYNHKSITKARTAGRKDGLFRCFGCMRNRQLRKCGLLCI